MNTSLGTKQFDGGQEMSMWMTLMHEAMAAQLHINGTDLKCLSLIRRYPNLKPSKIAAYMGLTRGSVTTMLDRLERGQFIERQRDEADGRQIRVALRHERQAEIGALYNTLGQHMAKLYGKYTPEQLKLIQDFMEELTIICRSEIERLQSKA